MDNNKQPSSGYNGNSLLNKGLIKDSELSFIIRKTEKVATAIYMITNFFDVHEPLKWELREITTRLLKNIMSFNNTALSQKEIVASRTSNDFVEIGTLFNLAYNSGFVSTMNFEIVYSEIENLSQTFIAYHEGQVSSQGAIFRPDYFEVKRDTFDYKKDIGQTAPEAIKDNNTVKDTIKDNVGIKDTASQNKGFAFNGLKKDLNSFFNKATKESHAHTEVVKDREEKILEKVRIAGPVTVKDVATDFADVSEKTIQRELQKMVDKGQIKKEGERRWTKYFID